MTPLIASTALPHSTPTRAPDPAPLRVQAQALEAAFLAEMLGYAGFGAARDSFGGGIGEDQFASFLRQEQATAIVGKGGIGLAESLFHALARGDHGRP
ncbi:MAG: chemotaxis protein chel [Rhodobacterales bacterium]|nr:chemotaxis protein chel [Rhodobacterales bacterium]NCO16667.1 chemotaxis protein chel [Alphaproteobacteria bacterium]